jgi:hypothetical protein
MNGRPTNYLRLGHNNFSHNRRAGGYSRFDHDQSQKGLYRVGADIHPIRNRLAIQALQQILQHLSFTLREVESLGNLRQRDES